MNEFNHSGNHCTGQLPHLGERGVLADDDEDIIQIIPTPHGVCPDCLGALERYQDSDGSEVYCPDCLRFGIEQN